MTRPIILMLEDVAFDTELIQSRLAEGGIAADVQAVDNREDFLQALKTCSLDLILADYALPNFDGLSALQMAQEQCPQVPFIIISGVLGEELAIETLKQGATDYILKQRLERLVPAVSRALKEAEERKARQTIEAALQASEERFRTSVETLLDCFGIYAAIRDDQQQIQDFRIEYVNTAACEQFGRQNEALIGQPLGQTFPEYRETGLLEAFCRVVETGQPLVRESLVYEDDKAETLSTALDVRATKLADGVVVTWRNITDRKRVEQERETLLAMAQNAQAEAEQANRFKDEFLATLSHELRTPLNAMQGWIQLLRRRHLDSAGTERALDTVQRNVDALKRLIDDVLDVSRIIRGKLRLNLTPTELTSVILAATETILPAAQAKQVALHTHLPSESVLIMGDRNRLQQIIWNLLSNAVKFTPSGGRVDVRLELRRNQVCIQVQDTGQGIDPEFAPHLFERFRQADSSTTRGQTGLGLGLAIVRHLTELHGGYVQAESAGANQGATFSVLLPAMPTAPDGADAAGAIAADDDLPRLENVPVLVVDDEADARELYTTMLKELGAVVQAAASCEEAITCLQQSQPAVVISDISMPEEDGYSLIHRIRQLQDGVKDVPAIALTAYARSEDRRQALAAGFQMHLPKPVEMAQLAQAVAQLAH